MFPKGQKQTDIGRHSNNGSQQLDLPIQYKAALSAGFSVLMCLNTKGKLELAMYMEGKSSQP